MYGRSILINVSHYTPAEVIQHNLIIAIVNFLESSVLPYLGYKLYPLKIVKFKCIVLTIFMSFVHYLLNNLDSAFELLLIQIFIIVFDCTTLPTVPIIYKYLPVFKGFRCVSLIYALSSAVVYIITSFGLIYCTSFLGHWGILVIVLPGLVIFMLSILHFENREKAAALYSTYDS